jgi:hypothetical protein
VNQTWGGYGYCLAGQNGTIFRPAVLSIMESGTDLLIVCVCRAMAKAVRQKIIYVL